MFDSIINTSKNDTFIFKFLHLIVIITDKFYLE